MQRTAAEIKASHDELLLELEYSRNAWDAKALKLHNRATKAFDSVLSIKAMLNRIVFAVSTQLNKIPQTIWNKSDDAQLESIDCNDLLEKLRGE